MPTQPDCRANGSPSPGFGRSRRSMQLTDYTTFSTCGTARSPRAVQPWQKVDKFFHPMEPRWDKLETSWPVDGRSPYSNLQGRDFRLRARDHGSRVAAKM